MALFVKWKSYTLNIYYYIYYIHASTSIFFCYFQFVFSELMITLCCLIYFVVLNYFTLSNMHRKAFLHVAPLGFIQLLNIYSVLIQTEGSKHHTTDLKPERCSFFLNTTLMTQLRSEHVEVKLFAFDFWFVFVACFLVHRLETVYQNHISCNSSVPPSCLMCPGESYIWKMTPANNLSSCADWCALLTFFFSTIAELQLSVG